MVETTQKLAGIITIFIMGIVGVILIQQIGDEVDTITELQGTVNETVLAINNTNSTLANGNVSSVVIVNSTGTILNTGNFTLFASAGRIFWHLTNETLPLNLNNTLWNVSYNWQDPDYLTSSTTRSIVDLVIIFFAIAVLIFVIIGFMKVGKEFMDMGR